MSCRLSSSSESALSFDTMNEYNMGFSISILVTTFTLSLKAASSTLSRMVESTIDMSGVGRGMLEYALCSMMSPSLPNLSPATNAIRFANSIQLFEGPNVRVGAASWGFEGLGLGVKRRPWLLFLVLGPVMMKGVVLLLI